MCGARLCAFGTCGLSVCRAVRAFVRETALLYTKAIMCTRVRETALLYTKAHFVYMNCVRA